MEVVMPKKEAKKKVEEKKAKKGDKDELSKEQLDKVNGAGGHSNYSSGGGDGTGPSHYSR
jgi:rRNA maturation endonuclease Nob1